MSNENTNRANIEKRFEQTQNEVLYRLSGGIVAEHLYFFRYDCGIRYMRQIMLMPEAVVQSLQTDKRFWDWFVKIQFVNHDIDWLDKMDGLHLKQLHYAAYQQYHINSLALMPHFNMMMVQTT